MAEFSTFGRAICQLGQSPQWALKPTKNLYQWIKYVNVEAAFIWKLCRFGISGALATLFYGTIAYILTLLTAFNFMSIHVVACVVSIPLSYLLQKIFTFRSALSHQQTFPRFMITAVVAFALSTGLAHWVTKILEYPDCAGFLSVMIIVPIISFTLMQFWVFIDYKSE